MIYNTKDWADTNPTKNIRDELRCSRGVYKSCKFVQQMMSCYLLLEPGKNHSNCHVIIPPVPRTDNKNNLKNQYTTKPCTTP